MFLVAINYGKVPPIYLNEVQNEISFGSFFYIIPLFILYVMDFCNYV